MDAVLSLQLLQDPKPVEACGQSNASCNSDLSCVSNISGRMPTGGLGQSW